MSEKRNVDDEIARYENLVDTGFDEIDEKTDEYLLIKQKIDHNKSLANSNLSAKEKIDQTQWLDVEELKALDMKDELQDGVIEEYLATQKMMAEEFGISDEERASNYIAQMSEEVESRRKHIEDLAREKIVVKELDKVLDKLKGLIDKIISESDSDKEIKTFVDDIRSNSYNINRGNPLNRLFSISTTKNKKDWAGITNSVYKSAKDYKLVTDQIRDEILKSDISHDDIIDALPDIERAIVHAYNWWEKKQHEKEKGEQRVNRNSELSTIEKIRNKLLGK